MTVQDIQKDLKKLEKPEKIQILSSFFKTGKGQYGEGDIFIGITVPDQRMVAKKYVDIKLSELQKLISSKIHEYRLTAFIILTYKYVKADEKDKKIIYDFYIKNRQYANNWDLVDVTTPKVIGAYLLDHPKERKILYKFATSKNLWERRIAILATYTFIKAKQFEDTLKISEILLNEEHDLIHKAVGWMLRELGKIDQKKEEEFLKKYYKKMPRTMLRYAIEKFSDNKKNFYMKK